MKDKDKSFFVKLILVVMIFFSFLLAFGLTVKNKRVINFQPQILVPPEPTAAPIVKDETSDWKTFKNEEYGFEIKYPSWNLGVVSSKIGGLFKIDFISSDTVKNNIKKIVTVSVFENSKNYPVDKWLKEYRDDIDNVNGVGLIFEKEFSVNGEKGLKGGFGCCMGYREAFFVAKGNYVYAVQGGYMDFDVKPLDSFYDYSEDFNQILSTFIFIKDFKFGEELSFISPRETDQWKMGEIHAIKINQQINNDSDSFIHLTLNKPNGEEIGIIYCKIGGLEKTVFDWDAKTIMTHCGASGFSPYKTIEPGTYIVSITADDTGRSILASSKPFSVISE